jgi:hypothetical protein
LLRKYLVILSVLPILLSACLKNDDPCHYFSLEKNVIYRQAWNVDSFTVYIYDSTSSTGYVPDTVYTNDGTFKFLPVSQTSCIDSGNILFAPPQGANTTLQYTIQAPGPNDYEGLVIQSPTSIDNFVGGDTSSYAYNLDGTKLYLTNAYFNGYGVCCSSYHPRIWSFVLSKN